ncbi:hypothetical protein LUZ63_000163 [Rhynchospora breviuscula]|uniref:Uncharacterized protein n=1 Tax=Rhynchospora breviuscula TaxID=2022672 RepID=A0A9Q0CVP5_9POAL|nr:hypothetical protein LUZ63_000163 [Rhynchospora breviuscula]
MIEKETMVEVLESSFVVPSEQTPMERMRLSNIDQVAPHKHIGFVYLYEGSQAKDFFSLEILKESLSKTLVLLYPLAGRFVDGDDGRKEINCNAEGCLFVVARSDLTSYNITFEPSPELRKLFVTYADFPGSLSLVAMVQVTYLKCGGVVLGVSTNHILIDGSSLFYFVQTWARITRGDMANIIPPSLDHNLLRGRSPPRITSHHPEYTTDPPPASFPTCVTNTFKISSEQIRSLKSQPRRGNRSTRISAFSIISGLVWKCYCICQGLTPSTQARLMFNANIRERLCPPLPKTYFGNAVIRKFATSKVSQITANPVAVVAEIVQAAIDGITDEFVRSFIDYLEVMNMKGRNLRPALDLSESELRIASISRFPVNDADFGWGAPQKLSKAEATGNNVVYVLDEPGNEGGYQLYVSLDPTLMPRFKKAFYQELVSQVIEDHGYRARL